MAKYKEGVVSQLNTCLGQKFSFLGEARVVGIFLDQQEDLRTTHLSGQEDLQLM